MLPAETRRRLGFIAGARLELIGLAALAGTAMAPSRDTPRELENFDPASALSREAKAPR